MIDFGEGVHLRALEKPPSAWRNNPSVWRWTRQNDLISEESHDAWFERQAKDPSIRMYQVGFGADIYGVCGFTSINWQNRNAEFSLYIIPERQGVGRGRMALKTLFYHGFKNMGLKTIWGETFENNPAQKLFRDIGMNEDGRRRQFYWKDGRYWDAILFSVINTEFVAQHGDKSCF